MAPTCLSVSEPSVPADFLVQNASPNQVGTGRRSADTRNPALSNEDEECQPLSRGHGEIVNKVTADAGLVQPGGQKAIRCSTESQCSEFSGRPSVSNKRSRDFAMRELNLKGCARPLSRPSKPVTIQTSEAMSTLPTTVRNLFTSGRFASDLDWVLGCSDDDE